MGNKLACISGGKHIILESKVWGGKAKGTSSDRKQPKISVKDFVFSYILGEGGFGKVSAGIHTKSGNWYAVKEIRINFKSQKKHAKQLTLIRNEITAHTLCKKHPYICNLYHSFSDQTSSYLVLDLYVGGDLRYHLLKGVVFTEQTTAFIVTCLASALHFLHKKKILHRDIKPDNIMFDEHGFPSLTDFGICHLYKDLPEEEHICSLSSGTRQYVAPEVLTSTHWHESPSDFWSLGIVAYELIYGERPFAGGCPDDFVEYNEVLQHMTTRYDDHSFELKMKCSQQPPLKKTAALKLLLPNRPFVVMPRVSIATQSVVSIHCRSFLKGLLDARPDQRLSYKALSRHAWFESQGCVWEKIIHCEVVPPFVPDTTAIAEDIQRKHAKYNNNDDDRNLDGGGNKMMQVSRPRNRRKKRRKSRCHSIDASPNDLDMNKISVQIAV